MKRLIYLVPLLIPFFISCEREKDEPFTSNAEEVFEILDPHNFLSLTPDTNIYIELYTEFRFYSDTQYVFYSEADGANGNQNWDNLEVSVCIDAVKIFDEESNSVPFTITEDKGVYLVKPSKAFAINSSFQLIIDYSYNAPETKYIHGVARSKTFNYNTTKSNRLNASMVYCEYPLERQYNFLQDEYGFGFIKTSVRPDFLLNESLKVIITNVKTEESSTSEILYDETLGILKYEMPQLDNNAIYRVDYYRANNAELYRSNYFKTSAFNKFSDKIGNAFVGEHQGAGWSIEPCFLSMNFTGLDATGGELMDYYEQILPSDIIQYKDFEKFNYPKLVSVQIDTVKTDLNGYGYNLARTLGFDLERSTDYIGVVPINDFFYVVNNNKEGSYSDIKLEDAEIQAKTVNDNDLISYTVVSYWAGVIMYDILGFKYHASNYLLDNNENPVAQKIVDIEHCEGARYGKYYYKMFYKIPGIDKIVFTGEYEVGPTN